MPIKLSKGARVNNLLSQFQWKKQKDTNLCWAACIEMLLYALKGVSEDQHTIYEKGLGYSAGFCATYTCNSPVEPEKIKPIFERLQLSSKEYSDPLDQDTLIKFLEDPVAVRCSDLNDQGHLILVVAHIQADKFFVLDPWPAYLSGSLTYQQIRCKHAVGKWTWTWYHIK